MKSAGVFGWVIWSSSWAVAMLPLSLKASAEGLARKWSEPKALCRGRAVGGPTHVGQDHDGVVGLIDQPRLALDVRVEGDVSGCHQAFGRRRDDLDVHVGDVVAVRAENRQALRLAFSFPFPFPTAIVVDSLDGAPGRESGEKGGCQESGERLRDRHRSSCEAPCSPWFRIDRPRATPAYSVTYGH